MPYDRTEGDKSYYRCDSCNARFQMGRAVYQGTYVAELDGTFCKGCFPAGSIRGTEYAKSVADVRRRMGK